MNLQSCVSVIYGCLLKIYDDVTDIPEIAPFCTPQIMETIKVFIIGCFTYMCIYNSNFALFTVVTHVVHLLFADKDSLQTHFYMAGMILAFVLSIVTFSSYHLSWVLLSSFILFMTGIMGDHVLFPENHSLKKIGGRIILVICIIIIGTENLVDLDVKLYLLGYLISSVIIMSYAELKQSNQSKLDTRESFNDSSTHRGIQQAVPNAAATRQHLSASSCKGSIGTKKS
jgi:hypothetical protein